MTLKENKTINKDFTDCRVYSGIKDYYGNSCYLVINDDMEEYRIMAKNPDYTKRTKKLPKYVIVPKYLEVIDLHMETATELEKLFPNYKHTTWQIW